MVKITFHLKDGRKVSNTVPFPVSSVSSGVDGIDIEHPKYQPIRLLGGTFAIFNEALTTAQYGKIVSTCIGVVEGNFAKGFKISKHDIRPAIFDLKEFSRETLRKILK